MTTPGYSGRPQATKLGLKPGHRVSLHQPPPGWALTGPPDGLAGPGPDGQADVIVAFFTEAGDIAAQIGDLGRRIYPAGALWVAWPRRAAGHRSDITESFIRDQALPIGWSTSRWPPSTMTGLACGSSGGSRTGGDAETAVTSAPMGPYHDRMGFT